MRRESGLKLEGFPSRGFLQLSLQIGQMSSGCVVACRRRVEMHSSQSVSWHERNRGVFGPLGWKRSLQTGQLKVLSSEAMLVVMLFRKMNFGGRRNELGKSEFQKSERAIAQVGLYRTYGEVDLCCGKVLT